MRSFNRTVWTDDTAEQLASLYFDLNNCTDCGICHGLALGADHKARPLRDHFDVLALLHHCNATQQLSSQRRTGGDPVQGNHAVQLSRIDDDAARKGCEIAFARNGIIGR